MNVLHVSTDTARDNLEVAGNTACTQRLLRALAERAELRTWTLPQSARPGTWAAAGRKAAHLLAWQFRSLRDVDVVIALSPYAMAALRLPCRLWRKPLVYDIDDNILPDLARFPLLPRIEWANRRAAGAIRAISRQLATYLREARIGTPVHYLPHGINLRDVPPERAVRPVELAGHTLVGYAGGFQAYQGVENLVDLLGVWPANGPRVTLVVVGVDPEASGHAAIRERLAAAPPGSIRAYPRQSPADTLRLLAMCDVLALPRPRVPIAVTAAPTKFVEYCALGKPVLATDVGDAAEWIRERGCGVVAADNAPSSLAGALETLLAGDLPAMGRASRRLAETEFNIERIADAYAALLAEVVRAHGRPRGDSVASAVTG